MADLIERDATYDAIGFERCGRSCTDCPTKCTWFYTVKNIPAVNRWIPCSEMLPETDTPVICYMRIGQILVMELLDDDGWYCGISRYNPRAVTHWMPLPEPPESEVQE